MYPVVLNFEMFNVKSHPQICCRMNQFIWDPINGGVRIVQLLRKVPLQPEATFSLTLEKNHFLVTCVTILLRGDFTLKGT